MSLNKSVAEYFYRVLGVKYVAKTVPFSAVYQVVFVAETSQDPAGLELIGKMAAAMKLSPEQWTLLDGMGSAWDQAMPVLEKAQHLVVFESQLFELLKNNFPHLDLHKIPSPQEMLAHPEKKRQAWDVLKHLMSQIS